MPNHASLTYGWLHDKLRALGFQEYRVELDGKSGRAFEHPTIPGTLLVLPKRKPTDLVESFYLQQVLVTLKSRGLLPEINPLLT